MMDEYVLTEWKQEVAKKRTRRVVKSKDAKEKKAASESKKKAEKAKSAASASAGKGRIQSKQGAKGAPVKVQAKSR